MAKINIALLAGGNSSEDVISYKSAGQLSKMIDNKRFNIFIIKVRGAEWVYDHPKTGSIAVDKNDFSITSEGKKIIFDCAFIAIHGTPGEDGLLQAYFDMLNIPYTTCGVFSSALTFNKYHCKQYLEQYNVASAKSLRLFAGDIINADDIINHVGLPCFVKPNEGGSSFGISKVSKKEDVEQAVKTALKEDDEVLVEAYLEGTEITCGLMKTTGKEIIFPVTEIVSTNDFFDYEAKYTPGKAQEITPARIPETVAVECKKLSSEIYDILDCRGIVRIDYIYSRGRLFFLEVNTVPGMSEASIIPQQIRAMKLSPTEVFTTLIDDIMKKAE